MKVYCVWSKASDPYAGDDYLLSIYSSEDKAILFVNSSNVGKKYDWELLYYTEVEVE